MWSKEQEKEVKQRGSARFGTDWFDYRKPMKQADPLLSFSRQKTSAWCPDFSTHVTAMKERQHLKQPSKPEMRKAICA
ncbi:hypothetical protein KSX_71520 [Ktedonospora formicarum]|uniref:Uncharacterized protein n=1 Tax=Ktedonospora formicarum TaxID=2778364 RepID=A0A8J3I437_9CHLR|nr:hypothetical protein KSX_71520 [Ktedonospora formicarum]